MKKYLITGAALLAPAIALAVTTLDQVIRRIGDLINAITPIVVAIALLFFFWYLANFLLKAGDEAERDKARQGMIWGIIALFVMVSVWGLVNVIATTFSVDVGTTIRVPEVQRR